MVAKSALQEWVIEALRDHGGSARPIDVARHVWEHHEPELRGSGDLFYTWQYDLRWAAKRLRDSGRLRAKHGERTGTWDLAEG